MSAMVRTSCRPEGDGLLSWVDEEGNASGWLGHALLDNRESVARSMKVMEHEWVVEIRIVEAVAEEGRRGMTFPVVEPVTVPA